MDDECQYINMLRKQRHDFMNDLQIVYGYLQLEDYSDAKQYIEKLCEINAEISELYSLGDSSLAYSLENLVRSLYYRSIEIDFDIEIEKFSNKYFKSDFDKKNKIVNNIIEEIEDKNINKVYIYIFANGEGEHVCIYNNETAFAHIACEKNNCSNYCNFNDIEIIKYESCDCIGFCFNFN